MYKVSLSCVVFSSLLAGARKYWAQERTGAREGDKTRVSPWAARARSLFHPLLPSAGYAGYVFSCPINSVTLGFTFCYQGHYPMGIETLINTL